MTVFGYFWKTITVIDPTTVRYYTCRENSELFFLLLLFVKSMLMLMLIFKVRTQLDDSIVVGVLFGTALDRYVKLI